MKYLILVGDGMADYPVKELGGRTPLMAAHTPHMDRLAQRGELGLVATIPKGYPKGSEIANLSIFGYDPRVYYTGRGPLEAPSAGVHLKPDDVAFRCNLVTLDALGGHVVMSDYSAGHITTEDGRALIVDLDRELGNSTFRFHPGVSYRHILVWKGGRDGMRTTPPHDISEKDIGEYLPEGEGATELIRLITDAQIFLTAHPQNVQKVREGKSPANSIWLWGQGRAPHMPTFQEKYGVTGSVISAVDLIKGIGIYAGLTPVEVPGATGYLDTNYEGKAAYALRALEKDDLVYVHVEAPDEASHGGDLGAKIAAIEAFDEKVVGTVLRAVEQWEEWAVMVLPDHPTPISLKTHTDDPVPYAILTPGSRGKSGASGFTEQDAKAAGILIQDGYKLMERFMRGGR